MGSNISRPEVSNVAVGVSRSHPSHVSSEEGVVVGVSVSCMREGGVGIVDKGGCPSSSRCFSAVKVVNKLNKK